MKKNETLSTPFAIHKIVANIGEGGSGTVYKTITDDSKQFAIKVLDPKKTTKEKLKRFKNEYLFCSSNTHTNIIKVIDYGLTSEGDPFFVMPLYDYSLRDLIGKLNPKEAFHVANKIMNGLEAAHMLGTIHRDIKPENILINNKGDELVIADFGIATFKEDDLYTKVETKHGTKLANFLYAAPEQRIKGKLVNHKADIYALGLVINELFTGEIPLGTNFKKIIDVDKSFGYLDEIVENMLAQNIASRPESIEEIKHQISIKGEEQLIFQKLSKLEKTVISSDDIDDPIVREPMKLVGVDWENEVLTLELNHPTNEVWIWSLKNMGNYQSIWHKGPDQFTFKKNQAQIRCKSQEAQQIIDHFKNWLHSTNSVYLNKLSSMKRIEDADKQAKLKAEINKEQERLHLLKTIKF